MIKAALDDAGLTIGDVDGVCHALSSMALAEYLRITPRWTDIDDDRRLVVRGARRARGSRDRRRALRRRRERLREHPSLRPPALRGRRPSAPARRWRRQRRGVEFEVPYGLRAPIAPYALGGEPPHVRVRHDCGAARGDRRPDTPMGHDESAGSIPRAHHRRRRARVALPGRAAPHARLLPRHRRRRRVRDDERRAGEEPSQTARLRARRRDCPRSRVGDRGDAEPRRRLPARSAGRTRSAWQG